MRLALEAADFGIWIRNLAQNEIWATDRWRALFGFNREERLELDSILQRIHPEDREMAAKSFWEGVHSGRGFAMETRSLRAKDGVYRWHLNQAVVLRDPEGRVLKFVGTTTDIDDQKRIEVALRQAQRHRK